MMPQRKSTLIIIIKTKYILVAVLDTKISYYHQLYGICSFLLTNFVSEMYHLVASSVSATLSVRVCCTLSACSLKSWLVLDSVLPMIPLNLSKIQFQNMPEEHDFKTCQT